MGDEVRFRGPLRIVLLALALFLPPPLWADPPPQDNSSRDAFTYIRYRPHWLQTPLEPPSPSFANEERLRGDSGQLSPDGRWMLYIVDIVTQESVSPYRQVEGTHEARVVLKEINDVSRDERVIFTAPHIVRDGTTINSRNIRLLFSPDSTKILIGLAIWGVEVWAADSYWEYDIAQDTLTSLWGSAGDSDGVSYAPGGMAAGYGLASNDIYFFNGRDSGIYRQQLRPTRGSPALVEYVAPHFGRGNAVSAISVNPEGTKAAIEVCEGHDRYGVSRFAAYIYDLGPTHESRLIDRGSGYDNSMRLAVSPWSDDGQWVLTASHDIALRHVSDPSRDRILFHSTAVFGIRSPAWADGSSLILFEEVDTSGHRAQLAQITDDGLQSLWTSEGHSPRGSRSPSPGWLLTMTYSDSTYTPTLVNDNCYDIFDPDHLCVTDTHAPHNGLYVQPLPIPPELQDFDGDDIPDTIDNCPEHANTRQEDTDGDGAGDLCDTDRDGDGIINASDNCPEDANSDQRNTDRDRWGDTCDSDDDNDGLKDTDEIEVYRTNPRRADTDGDCYSDGLEVAIGTDPRNSRSRLDYAAARAKGIPFECDPFFHLRFPNPKKSRKFP